ncbi:hypothetical protein DealDRAFT_0782 [Dethiobacter alkaliphilus AHT 1]|uniref:Uncharacterized protein n=1 Tax=Dethiobacter alkaliphilus AHT 1 TaxID=555088 RepID=C0GE73_DETAL|nr:hypothetical protein DealDRAFT_0782 [Dethiobacter alkaliphilus AHT 1]
MPVLYKEVRMPKVKHPPQVDYEVIFAFLVNTISIVLPG